MRPSVFIFGVLKLKMEGYLLAFSKKERHAQLWFCVLEHGALRCFTKPNGLLVESIQLTRHHIRVVVSADSDSACPNQFTVGVTEAKFDEASGVLRAARGNERVHCFAAPTAEAMRRWGRAIQSWRRRAFDAPKAAESKEEAAVRRKALREEAQELLYFVTAFDLLLKLAAPTDKEQKKKSPMVFRRSLLPSKSTNSITQTAASDSKQDRQSLPAATGTSRLKKLTSWMPPVPLPSWRRVRASDPTDESK